jgi:hypothetical protein
MREFWVFVRIFPAISGSGLLALFIICTLIMIPVGLVGYEPGNVFWFITPQDDFLFERRVPDIDSNIVAPTQTRAPIVADEDYIEPADSSVERRLNPPPTATIAPPIPPSVTVHEPTTTVPPSNGAKPKCPNPYAQMTNPPMNTVIKGVLEISGTAVRENFDYYKFEYLQEGTTIWNWLARIDHPVQNGKLLSLKLTEAAIPDGPYWLRLTVVDTAGNFWPEDCVLRIIVQH